ncbi:hypothetical protein Nepgr_023525 [Nepenthes gracilis]|uniref:Uncharacterized protein n=1 Tax=Nepenthes gracilis TaxID=150966 RepID=A0AAD3T267_NEPGR|nr:hypothetical protein Nepgr_023525 [Nepenthes gracilis]
METRPILLSPDCVKGQGAWRNFSSADDFYRRCAIDKSQSALRPRHSPLLQGLGTKGMESSNHSNKIIHRLRCTSWPFSWFSWPPLYLLVVLRLPDTSGTRSSNFLSWRLASLPVSLYWECSEPSSCLSSTALDFRPPLLWPASRYSSF